MSGGGRALPLSLVVFAFNEAENVPGVLGEIAAWLRSAPIPYELLFVDDGSTDGTAEAARAILAGDPSARVLVHPTNRGIGAALKTGVAGATLPWVTFLPCDGQILPGELDALVAAALDGDVDLVLSVYRDRDDGAVRTLLSFGIRAMMRGLLGVRLRSDGPYLFRRPLFLPAALPPDTFFLNFEFPIRLLKQGRPHRVVSIGCRPRRAGHSKSTGWKRMAGVARDLWSLRRRLAREADGRGTG